MRLSLSIVALALSIPASLAKLTSSKRANFLRTLQESGDCEICSQDNKNRPDFITIQYEPEGANSRFQDASKATCREGAYPTTTSLEITNKDGIRQSFPNISAGDTMTIVGPFDAETTFKYETGECYIHTSCSVPLVSNDQIGAFKVLAGTGCGIGQTDGNGTGTTTTQDSSCEICSQDNKNRPDSLTLQYKPVGAIPNTKISAKLTTSLEITNKAGIRQIFPDVSAGDTLTIVGPFDAETTFKYETGECYIHTSCSVPLVSNDQIGAFKVLAGTGCGIVGQTDGTGTGTTMTPDSNCEICSQDNKNRPDSLTLQYKPVGVNSQYQDISKATCVEGDYPESTTISTENKNGIRQTFAVTDGDNFTITGPFNAETTFDYGTGDCFIHTSCSVPLMVGDQIGAFQVMGGNDCQGPDNVVSPVDGTPEGMCEICSKDNKDKPEFLVIQYVPVGVDSQYQDEDRATCRGGNYPATTTIVMTNKDGTTQTFPNVRANDIFTIQGPFNAETTFSYDGGDCFIHTSCSAPLVTNDQIGPFKMLAGNECNADPEDPEDTVTVPPVEEPPTTGGNCEICSEDNKNKPNSITFQYSPVGLNSQYQEYNYATCREGTYPTSTKIVVESKNGDKQTFEGVSAGEFFTITGPFNAATTFSYDGGNCFIHTSCSVPLVTGDHIGPFIVHAGNECSDGQVETLPPVLEQTEEAPCEICSKNNGEQPVSLTLVYRSDGKESMYQDEKEATCGAGTYPESTTIVFTNAEGVMTAIDVQDGQPFTIVGPFKDMTTFQLSGETTKCSIELSCDAPLVAGDQLGPFLITEGNDCKYETSSPTQAPSPSPSAAPSISVSPSPAPTGGPSPSPSELPSPAPSDAPSTSPPTAEPTSAPSASPSDAPSPSPSVAPSISSSPSLAPTGGPSPSPSEAPSPFPSSVPSVAPSQAPTRQPCVSMISNEFSVGESIDVSYNVDWVPEDPLTNNGWICIYPCSVTEYFQS
eukprot:CAMPEP_0119029336 /NCGR_PEP_ID=MMETSP1176-20130426/40463_1 /TAXON_ID=265551 /ORGANISM="Synedropsis recta cf, Strain CCMP1620" /LENGTH=981 /DNA_ID=CAMNT_0006985671 /DNA_START=64 /DNA_END=3007 /DNA_ORIENTATION=-